MILRRASRYSLLVFTDGRHWRRLLTISRQSGTTDALSFPPVTVKYVRLQILAATAKQPPLLQELTVTG